MAGSFPDPPARRMAYDRDGTVVVNTRTLVQLTKQQIQDLNNEDVDRRYDDGPLAFIFPEARTVTHWFAANEHTPTGLTGSQQLLEGSNDTTNGSDGTWATVHNNTGAGTTIYGLGGPAARDNWRTRILAVPTPTSYKAVRLTYNFQYYNSAVHFYGDKVTLDSLDFWHPTLDQRLDAAAFEFGNSPQRNVADKQFRIKNNSSLTANGVAINVHPGTDTVIGTPALFRQFQFSADGVNFSDTLHGFVAADNFNRADSTGLGTMPVGGLTWSETGGSWRVIGNQMAIPATTSGEISALFNPGVSDGYFELLVSAVVHGHDMFMFRHGANDNSCWAWRFDTNLLFRPAGGSFSGMGGIGRVIEPGDRLGVHMDKDKMEFFLNDKRIHARVDNRNSTNTRFGVGSANAQASRWDDVRFTASGKSDGALSLAAGAISPVYTVRRSVQPDASLGTFAAAFRAFATSYS